jgi:UDP-N-acetyl-D-mannosaminuronic acid transferase (WecB/TagA/CpsF family)
MQGSLGQKIGEGVFADVHAWAPGQVVKLSKPSIPRWVLQHEAQMTRAVFAAGGPVPEVLGRSHPGRPLWHRAAAVRWADAGAGYAHRCHHV